MRVCVYLLLLELDAAAALDKWLLLENGGFNRSPSPECWSSSLGHDKKKNFYKDLVRFLDVLRAEQVSDMHSFHRSIQLSHQREAKATCVEGKR